MESLTLTVESTDGGVTYFWSCPCHGHGRSRAHFDQSSAFGDGVAWHQHLRRA